MKKSINELLEIQKVEKNTEMADNLLEFVENFSWTEVKDHTLQMIKNWQFEEWEAPFAATVCGQIVGMATVMKSDYYPLPDIYPWISTIFVAEEYRGHKISGKIIDYANNYAKMIGFDRTFIPTEFVGLYEKYGYRYVKDIVNYGNKIDRLYVKELK